MITVCKIFTFHAAHRLPNHPGACSRLHGHQFKLEIEVRGPRQLSLGEKGMIIDFQNLKKVVEPIIEMFDHSYINEVDFPYNENPTAENMVQWIADILSAIFSKKGIPLARVRLWETETSYAEWKEGF